jgi:sortase B
MIQHNRLGVFDMSRKRNKFLIALIILLVAAIIGTLAYIVVKNLNENNERKSLDNIAGSYASGIENGTTSATESATEVTSPSINVKKVENPIDFKSLQQQNSDIYSWIYIPNTNVNYPVLQSHLDDNLYLDHDIYKNYSFSGSIYSQMCNKRDYSDRVTVLYGHNMANGSMFATLHRFYDADFFNKNRYIYVYTPDRKLTYEIVSAFEYDNRHIMNTVLQQTKEDLTTPIDLFNASAPYSCTNLNPSKVSYLAQQAVLGGMNGIDMVSVPGQVTMGSKYAEFNVSEAEFYQLFLSIYYTKIE